MRFIKSICFLIFTFFVIGTSDCNGQNSIKATNSFRPVLTGQNNWYVGNKAPLLPASFIKLPLGSIKPEGWILKLLELQKDGLSGHLGEISAWLEKKDNAWLTEGGEHGWEEVPYWLRGYADMAFIFDDPEMKKETMIWIEAILKGQNERGWVGPEIRNGEKEMSDCWRDMMGRCTRQDY